MTEKNRKREHVTRNLGVRFILAVVMIPILLFTAIGLTYFALLLIYSYFFLEPAAHNAISTFAFVFFLACTLAALFSVIRAITKLVIRLQQQWRRYRTMKQEVARLRRLRLEGKRKVTDDVLYSVDNNLPEEKIKR